MFERHSGAAYSLEIEKKWENIIPKWFYPSNEDAYLDYGFSL